MSTVDTTQVDVEANGGDDSGVGDGNLYHRRWRRHRRSHKPSLAASTETATDGSFRFSDSDSDQSRVSAAGGSYEECRCSNMPEQKRQSRRGPCSVSGCLPDVEIDLESGELELKGDKEEKQCRICHLSLLGSCGIGGGSGGNYESSGAAIELGCSCKGDLGTAHKQCAETWFKIKGNTTCEICGAKAQNIAGEQASEENNAIGAASTAPVIYSETQSIWHGRRIMNFLLACMVFAFVISWLFHFNILP